MAHKLQEEKLHEKQFIFKIPIIGVGRKLYILRIWNAEQLT